MGGVCGEKTMIKLAVIFIGQLRRLEETRKNHSWLWKNTLMDIDVFVQTWDTESLKCEVPSILDFADVGVCNREEMQKYVKEQTSIVDNDYIDRHFSQFWCQHYLSQRVDFERYDAVLRLRTDCVPTNSAIDHHVERLIRTTFIERNFFERPGCDEITMCALSYINRNASALVEHYMIQTPSLVKSFGEIGWFDKVIDLYQHFGSGNQVWFEICSDQLIIPQSVLGGTVLK